MFNLLFLSLQEKGAAEKPVSTSLSTLSTFLPPVQDIAAVNHNFMHTWLQYLLGLFVFSPVWSEISCVLVMADSYSARIHHWCMSTCGHILGGRHISKCIVHPPPFFNVLNEDRTQGLTHARYMLCLWNPFPALGLLLSQICSSLEIFCHKSLGERGAVRIKAISDLRQKQWSVQPHIWHALLHMYHKEQSPVGMHTGPQMLCCNNGEFNYLLWREVEEFLNSLY